MDTSHDDLDDVLSEVDDESASATATLDVEEAPDTTDSDAAGPCCQKCHQPLQSDVVTVCRHCGWYASLGIFVEVDQDYEVDFDAPPPPTKIGQPSHVAVWLNLLPRWAWIVIATAAVIVVESVVARLATPAGSSLRTYWSLTQLAVGGLAFAVCHVFNFLVAVADDAEVGVLDLVLKPVKLWLRACAALPQRLWVTNAAAAGATAVAMSLVVIGGLPYERLWDWGFEKPPEQNLMGAIADRAQQMKGRGADDLQGAVSDFAGSQDLEPGAGAPTPPPPPKPREQVDCVILGYRLDTQGRLTSLVLGAAHRKKLAYAGSLTPKLSADEESRLIAALERIKTHRPFLDIQTSAVWVEPKLSCQVSYTRRQDNGRLQDPQLEKMLGVLGLE